MRSLLLLLWLQKNRELEKESASSKKKDAGEYDVVVRQLQFEMKGKVSSSCTEH